MAYYNPDEIAIPNGHFSHGQLDSSTGHERHAVTRPSDGVVYAEIPIADGPYVDRVVRASYESFRSSDWATRAPRDRAKVLMRWAELVEDNCQYLAQLESLGSSRTYQDVLQWDIPYVADTIRFFAEMADKDGGYVGTTQSNRFGMVVTEPYGVVGAITPWNFPMSMAMWKAAPALAAGNAVVMKPSELTPFSTLCLAQLAIDAGLPNNMFNVVLGTGQVTGAALCEHPLVSRVTFTGSTQTGANIMSACALTGPKPATLELGGKSPQIVFADAPDIELAASMVAKAITGNAGQVCVSGSRLIIEQALYEQFIPLIIAHFKQLIAGKTWEQNTTLGPIISEQQLSRIESIIQKSISDGSQCLYGGERIIGHECGTYFQPTILKVTGCDDIAIMQEIFGPVLTVQTFTSEQEAWQLASHNTYGLAAGVHTSNLDRALRAVRNIEAGSVWINRYGRTFDHIMPTGGYKCSGIGKDIGKEAFEENRRSKTVMIDFDLNPSN
ncbi:aldehyde dehydrogenase family protein [Vibrio sp. CAIM 722]|uniref:Aldehyde dehydrogenase family protein n=1 Tax=Vibrio eleionomae TaxID=2653505 RepID=A0A7X4LLG3_9VIBR|nr:aldehyde dehydrogenase family protein [Vibrio eleionomae]MZI94143.1 aldehyde dehydrogenase family protein [Vibrio eleionomae]